MPVFSLVRPLIFLLDAETAHRTTIAAMKLVPAGQPQGPDTLLGQHIAGLDFPNPIGLAAGFDKDAEIPRAMFRYGFGAVEVGTLTPLPQHGNPKPRLFRLVEDQGVINRMGFNNGGQLVAYDRLKATQGQCGIIGVNIGANKDSEDRIADYVAGIERMSDVASYLTVNISSPNTPGLRALQDEGALAALLDAVNAARKADGPPVFLKVAPDLEPSDIDAIARLTMGKIDALIVSNTTISRPKLASSHAAETGGLSGAPVKALAQQRLIDFRKATGGKMPLIGVGGICNADDAYARIRAGASLVQLYSALVFHGPGLVSRINAGLKERLTRDGFANISEAVGVDAA